jgi:LPS export ABC transporter permease LptG
LEAKVIRLVDRYIAKEMLVPLLIGTVSVVMMFLANTLIAYAGQIFKKEIPFSAVGQYLLFKIPITLNMTLPIGITIASALAMSRLSRETELTAIRAAGAPVRRAILPMVVMGLAVSLVSFWLAEAVTPKAEERATKTLRNIFASAEAVGLKSNVLISLNGGEYNANIGTVRKGEGGGVLMSDVFIYHKPKRGEDWQAQAASASYKDGILTLFQPVILQMEGEKHLVFKPEKYVINVRVSLDDFFGYQQPDAMTSQQLRKTIATMHARGQETRGLEVDLQNKYAVPAACLVFSLFSPVFALRFSRGGAFIGVLVSIIIVFLYYNVWVLCAQVLSKQWLLPPIVGAWLPNVLFLLAGVVALWRSE